MEFFQFELIAQRSADAVVVVVQMTTTPMSITEYGKDTQDIIRKDTVLRNRWIPEIFVTTCKETLGTRRVAGSRGKYTGGVLEYKITGLDVTPNVLAPSDPANAQRFEANAVVWLEVSCGFGEGRHFLP